LETFEIFSKSLARLLEIQPFICFYLKAFEAFYLKVLENSLDLGMMTPHTSAGAKGTPNP